jgi:hypothetical protein
VARVVVVADLPHSLLLGTDLLRQYRGTINYAQQLVHLNGHAFPFLQCVSDQVDCIGDTRLTTGDEAIDRILRRHARAFHQEGDAIGHARHTVPMRIITKGPPLAQRAYRAPLLRRRLIDEEIDKMLRDGVIRPSQSPWSSPVLVVPKKGSGARVVVDYRRLNSVTKRDQYPLPYIQEIFDTVGNGCVFSTIDLKVVIINCPLTPRISKKTHFHAIAVTSSSSV